MRCVKNPPNPYEKYSAEYIGEPPPTKLEVFEETGNLRHRNMEERNAGKTELWQTAVKMFDLHFKRLGFEQFERAEKIEKKILPVQQSLF